MPVNDRRIDVAFRPNSCYTRRMKISPLVGLCATCKHVKVIKSAKGSFFLMCRLAQTDPRFEKYPPLPVLQCLGYESPIEEDEEETRK